MQVWSLHLFLPIPGLVFRIVFHARRANDYAEHAGKHEHVREDMEIEVEDAVHHHRECRGERCCPEHADAVSERVLNHCIEYESHEYQQKDSPDKSGLKEEFQIIVMRIIIDATLKRRRRIERKD